MDVPLIADMDAIRGRRQQLIDEKLIRLNKKFADHSYSVNDRVLLRVADPVKLCHLLNNYDQRVSCSV